MTARLGGVVKMIGTFVFRDGRIVPKSQAAPLPRGPRSGVAAPMLIRDQMDALQGMHDGKLYDSKSALRASYRAAGVNELGNDAPTTAQAPARPGGFREDVARAFNDVRNGYKPQIEMNENAPNQTGWSEYNAAD